MTGAGRPTEAGAQRRRHGHILPSRLRQFTIDACKLRFRKDQSMQDKWRNQTLIISIGALLILMSCISRGTLPDGASSTPAVNSPAPNSYFYYTEAEVLKNRGDTLGAIHMMQRAMESDPESIYVRRELAMLYLQIKKEDEALELLQGILKDAPGDVPTLLVLGHIYQNRKQLDQAKAVYEDILDQDPDKEDVYLLLGNLYLNDGQFEEALDVFDRLTKRFPDAYAGYFFIGKIHRERGDDQGAEKAFLKSLAIEPKLEGARYELIDIYEHRPDSPATRRQTLEQYRAILEEDPGNVRAILGMALYDHTIGNDRESRKLLQDLAQATSENDLVRNIFRLYLEPDQNNEAVYLLEQILQTRSDYGNLQYLLGMAYHNLGKDAQAMTHFQKVPPESQFYRDAVIQQAFRYSDDGQVDRAIALLKEALAHEPEQPDFLIYLASMYEEKGAYEEALGLLQRVIAADPENERAYFRLGVVYDKMGRKDDSIAAMKQVLLLKPDHANALNYLGYTYADLGIHLDEAEKLIQKALTLKPDDGYITDSLGWVYYKQGRYREALIELQKAAALVGDDPTILEHVGDAYLKLGQSDKALQYYRKSLEVRKEDKEAVLKKIRALEKGAP
jgi:tetratricopeptide (TPR) repeat protein